MKETLPNNNVMVGHLKRMKLLGNRLRTLHRELFPGDPFTTNQLIMNLLSSYCVHKDELLERYIRSAFACDKTGQESAFLALFWAAAWCDFGCPVFRLSPSLAAALLLSECPKTNTAAIKLPFPAIMVSIPKASPLSISGFDLNERGPVTNITVFDFLGQRGTSATSTLSERINLTAYVLATTDTPVNDLLPLIYDLAPPPNRCLFVQLNSSKHLASVYNRSPTLDQETSIQDWITAISGSTADDDEFLLDDKDENVLTATERLVVNLSFYLQEKVYKKPKRCMVGHNKGSLIHSLGSEVSLPSQLTDAAYAYAHRGIKPKKWKARSRFVVRGHWRNQPHGPQKSLRKQKWIQPHWKGPKTNEEIERLYSVETIQEAGLTDD